MFGGGENVVVIGSRRSSVDGGWYLGECFKCLEGLTDKDGGSSVGEACYEAFD